MTREVIRTSLVDVGRDDAVQIAPSNDKPKDYTALVNTFAIVANPGYGIGDAREDTAGAEEGSKVFEMRVLDNKKHCKADHTNGSNTDVAETTLAFAISNPADKYGQDSSCSVDRDSKHLGVF